MANPYYPDDENPPEVPGTPRTYPDIPQPDGSMLVWDAEAGKYVTVAPGGERPRSAPPPAGATTPPGATGGFFGADGTFGGDYQGYFKSLFPGQTTLTGDQLKAKEAELKKAGINVVTSASGNTAFINYPGSNGDVDVIGDYGGANTLQWIPPGSGGGGGNAASNFSYPGFTPPPFDLPDYQQAAPFDYAGYQPLTADTFKTEPGYEFARTEGLRAITNNASAEGLVRTGGTLKSLMSYGTGLADQNFADADARGFRNWSANRGNQADIYDRGERNKLTNWMRQYNVEADEFNRANQVYGVNFGTAATSAGINADSLNSAFNRNLSLYDISTRDLPRYNPTVQSPQYGFSQ